MRLHVICIYIMAMLLALLCGLQQGVAQVDDADLGVAGTETPSKQRFPVWNDADGEWTDQDN